MVWKILATGGALIGLWQAWKNYKAGGMNWVVRGYTGYNMSNGVFDIKTANSLIPTAVGAGASYIIAKTGANSYYPKGANL